MRTISSKVSEREHTAIQEYANQTGESVSNLIRKVVIRDTVFADGFCNVPDEYGIDSIIIGNIIFSIVFFEQVNYDADSRGTLHALVKTTSVLTAAPTATIVTTIVVKGDGLVCD
ncbi:MAG: hypothetical protein EX285_04595 [Thaumarchaeota archaeon]|nr:hypothetical protein [Nitrososphaerota archaeon]